VAGGACRCVPQRSHYHSLLSSQPRDQEQNPLRLRASHKLIRDELLGIPPSPPRKRVVLAVAISHLPECHVHRECNAPPRGAVLCIKRRARARSRERRLLSKRGHSACDCFDKSSLKAIVSVTPAISTAFNYAALPRKSESIDPSRASHRPATRYAERLPLRCSRNLVTPLIPPVLSLQLDVHGNQLIIIMRAN